MFPSQYEDAGAQKLLNEWQPVSHGPLVQIAAPPRTRQPNCRKSQETKHGDRDTGAAKIEQLRTKPDEIEVAPAASASSSRAGFRSWRPRQRFARRSRRPLTIAATSRSRARTDRRSRAISSIAARARAGRLVRSHHPVERRRQGRMSPTPISRRLRLPAAIPPPARPSRPG